MLRLAGGSRRAGHHEQLVLAEDGVRVAVLGALEVLGVVVVAGDRVQTAEVGQTVDPPELVVTAVLCVLVGTDLLQQVPLLCLRGDGCYKIARGGDLILVCLYSGKITNRWHPHYR